MHNTISFLLLLGSIAFAAQRSAVISLVMPIGARQTSLGESGTALYEDPFTAYWNPAGLAMSPLASTWDFSYPQPQTDSLRWISGQASRGFLSHPQIWAASTNNIYQYQSNHWQDFMVVPLANKNLDGAIRKFLGHENNLETIYKEIRAFNQIENKDDENFLVDIKIPLKFAIQGDISQIHFATSTGVLWVSTTNELRSFDGIRWKTHSSFPQPEQAIQSILSVGQTLWVGTNKGLFRHKNGQWKEHGKVLSKSDKITSLDIRSLTWQKERQELYITIHNGGIARLRVANKQRPKNSWSLYNLEDGLLDLKVEQITIDASGHVWASHPNGLSHFNHSKWENYKFAQTAILSLEADEHGDIWIGTNKGLWQYSPAYNEQGPSKTTLRRNVDQITPAGEWTHHHKETGLQSNKISHLTILGREAWLVTSAGIERYKKAPSQIGVFYEKLLPSLEIPELYHLGLASTIPIQEWGTIGFFINYLSFGGSSKDSQGNGTDPDKVSSELVLGASYGTLVTNETSLGLNFKFFHSDLTSGASGAEVNETYSYALDLGLLWTNVLFPKLDAGIALSNIGPSVFYSSPSNSNPIPLTWNFGLAYTAFQTPNHRLLFTGDYHRETISENTDDASPDPFYISAFKGWGNVRQEDKAKGGFDRYKHIIIDGVFGVGGEYTYLNSIIARLGYLHDEIGQRKEVNLGGAYLLSDAISFDVGVIKAISGGGVRDGQFRFSVTTKL